MRHLRYLVVIGALAGAMSVIATGPAVAAKGGNKGTAKQCQKGGWNTLVSQTGEPFANPGDCVNDGAKGLGAVPPSAGATACANLHGSFSSGGDGALWECTYPVPPNPERPSALEDACGTDSGGEGFVSFDPGDGEWSATCGGGN
jgi:hypothetical protein